MGIEFCQTRLAVPGLSSSVSWNSFSDKNKQKCAYAQPFFALKDMRMQNWSTIVLKILLQNKIAHSCNSPEENIIYVYPKDTGICTSKPKSCFLVTPELRKNKISQFFFLSRPFVSPSKYDLPTLPKESSVQVTLDLQIQVLTILTCHFDLSNMLQVDFTVYSISPTPK